MIDRTTQSSGSKNIIPKPNNAEKKLTETISNDQISRKTLLKKKIGI